MFSSHPNLDNPVLLASAIPDGVESCTGIGISGNHAYLSSWGGLGIVAISDPAEPVSVGFFGSAVWTSKFAVSGDLLYSVGIRNPSRLQRCFRDMCVGAGHMVFDDRNYNEVAKKTLGLETAIF